MKMVSLSEKCIVCDELLFYGDMVKVKGMAMISLIKAKKRQDVKWQPPNSKFLIVHMDCIEAYTKSKFSSLKIAPGNTEHTISKN